VRRLAALGGAIGLAIAGSQVAHALAYRLAEPVPEARERLLAQAGHGYLDHLPLGIALVSSVVLLALFAEAAGTPAGARSTTPRAWLFLVLAPLTFAGQEHLERLLAEGSFPWHAAGERTFLLGLALQLPFALAAWLLARLLLHVARAVAALAAPALPALHLPPARGVPHVLAVPATRRHLADRGPRGPPALSV
jgi:hypothetical protein